MPFTEITKIKIEGHVLQTLAIFIIVIKLIIANLQNQYGILGGEDMTRGEAAQIYLDGLMTKNVSLEQFFEAVRTLSDEDRMNIEIAINGYKIKRINKDG
jgi:hypothetical protein